MRCAVWLQEWSAPTAPVSVLGVFDIVESSNELVPRHTPVAADNVQVVRENEFLESPHAVDPRSGQNLIQVGGTVGSRELLLDRYALYIKE
jgi:hypothetical protein